ncbi:hypothetical protein DYB37_001471 [Aphanomyces astaci]|uniref:Uncharacterized protein n=1 Tax=Aphanomyces astaci TaxID=112090 RepID=A0A3R7BIS8_APHAT|nr:hypothetical protein DYB35_011514 [Aphanomyces astaci]RHZ29939.1 hypothetical protein DYB37_001471 [Aphanomyces astaci]
MSHQAPTTAAPLALTTPTPVPRPCRMVAFGGVTEYRFALGHGGSAIPSLNGPAVGLIGQPLRVKSRSLRRKRPRQTGLHRYTREERVEILKKAGHQMKEIVDFCMDALDVRLSRRQERPTKRLKQSAIVLRNTEINASANICYDQDEAILDVL